MDQGTGRLRAEWQGPGATQASRFGGRSNGGAGPPPVAADAFRYPLRRDISPAYRGAPSIRVTLHAAVANRADCPNDLAAHTCGAGREAAPRADPGPKSVRPGDGVRSVSCRGVPLSR